MTEEQRDSSSDEAAQADTGAELVYDDALRVCLFAMAHAADCARRANQMSNAQMIDHFASDISVNAWPFGALPDPDEDDDEPDDEEE